MIVRCAGAADVIAAVQFAHEHHALISMKGGGHNVSGKAVCNGGLMIQRHRRHEVNHALNIVDVHRCRVRA
jgi:FAD/FMN-containing dehydrogenase